MTKTQLTELEIKVAVMQGDISNIKDDISSSRDDTKSVKNLLKWFMVLAVTIIGLVIVNIWSNSGDKKVMQSILQHNSEVIGDMVQQGISNGWYKPDKETYRGVEEIN